MILIKFFMKKIHCIGYIVLQWSWGILQNVIGGVLYLSCLKKKHTSFRGAIVTEWHNPYSLGCGMFIFLSNYNGSIFDSNMFSKPHQYDILVHEYGHTLQSIILGPLFLIIIALPSIIWSSLFDNFRKKRNLSYYWLYCERWANILGDKVCGNKRIED